MSRGARLPPRDAGDDIVKGALSSGSHITLTLGFIGISVVVLWKYIEG